MYTPYNMFYPELPKAQEGIDNPPDGKDPIVGDRIEMSDGSIYVYTQNPDGSFGYVPEQVNQVSNNQTSSNTATVNQNSQTTTQSSSTPTGKPEIGTIVSVGGKRGKIIGYDSNGKPNVKALDEKELRFLQYQDEKLKPASEKGWTIRKSKTPYDPYGKQTYDPNSGGYTYNNQPLDWNDFKERHQELIESELHMPYDEWEKQVKSTNKSVREKATKAFQEGYNRWYKEATGENYFSGDTENLPYGIDSKPGIYTTSAPGLSKPKTPTTPPPPPNTPPQEKPPLKTPPPGIIGPPGKIPRTGWFAQDINNLLGAGMDWASINKYLPWAPPVEYANYNPTFYDPDRELANINEQMNIGVQGANAYGTPQAFNAGFAQMQGKGFENAANVLSKYNDMNVGVANDAAKVNAGIDTQRNIASAARATDQYDKWTVANQQFDNARRDARNKGIQAFNTGMTNAAMARTVNYMHPEEYFLNPATGGDIYFNPNNLRSLDDQYKTEQARREQHLNDILSKDAYKNYSVDDKLKLAEFIYGNNSKTKNDNSQLELLKTLQEMFGANRSQG